MEFTEVTKLFGLAKSQVILLSEIFYNAKYTEKLVEWGFMTFNEFCASPEIDTHIRRANSYADTYKSLVIDKGIDAEKLFGISFGKIKSIRKVTETKELDYEQILDWVEKARQLSSSDFNSEVSEALGRITRKEELYDLGVKGRYKLIKANNEVPLDSINTCHARFFQNGENFYIEL